MEQGKIGLVVEGGGMKCAYNAGILDAFLDAGISFDYCIGVSAGSGNLASYLAGQRGRNLRFFTEHIHSPRYFGREMMKQDDYRLIMASSAIPVVCHPVELNGVPYFDGGLTDAIPVRRALEQGCGKLVVILSKNRDYVRKPQGMRRLYSRVCRSYPNIVDAIERRHIVYNENMKDVFSLERQGVAFVFAASEPIHVGTYSIKEDAERELYDLGLRDFAQQREQLQAFLRA